VQKAREASSRIAASRAAIARDAAALTNATKQVQVLTAQLAAATAGLALFSMERN
jgi:membrane fusion protein, multidrug efflux system